MSISKVEIIIKFIVLLIVFAIVAKASNFSLINSEQVFAIPVIAAILDIIAYIF